MNNLDGFGRQLADVQDELLATCGYIEEARRMISFEAPAYPRRHTPRRAYLIAGSMAVAAAAALFLLIPREITVTMGGSSIPEGTWIASANRTASRLDFSDGSRVAIDPGSRIRVQDLTPNGAYLLLEKGWVRASVKHIADTDWRLHAGPYLVSVNGTRFDMYWNPDPRELTIRMREGSVRVDGPLLPTGTRLKKGDQLFASLSANRFEVTTHGEDIRYADLRRTLDETPKSTASKVTSEEPAPAASADVNERSQDAPSSLEQPARRSRWRHLLEQHRFNEMATGMRTTDVGTVSGTASAVELLTLADEARHVGNQALAAALYKSVRRRFSKTAHASEAAFALGKMAFDQNRDYRRAARWFNACLADSRTNVLEREALGRLMESLKMSGETSGAATVAEKYLSRFPKGPHAALARNILGIGVTLPH